MRNHLPSCRKLHPDTPPDIYSYVRATGLTQRYCRKCLRIRYHKLNPTALPRRSPRWHTAPHGVHALNWTPPRVFVSRETQHDQHQTSEVTA